MRWGGRRAGARTQIHVEMVKPGGDRELGGEEAAWHWGSP